VIDYPVLAVVVVEEEAEWALALALARLAEGWEHWLEAGAFLCEGGAGLGRPLSCLLDEGALGAWSASLSLSLRCEVLGLLDFLGLGRA
jgi:hypothetical protein